MNERKIEDLTVKIQKSQRTNTPNVMSISNGNTTQLGDQMNNFDPSQVDDFTMGLNQMKEYIDSMKHYAEKTDKEMKSKFKRMLEEQNAMRQFHFDNVESGTRHRQFINDLRQH